MDDFKFMFGAVTTMMLATILSVVGFGYYDSKSIDTVEANQETTVKQKEVTHDYLLVVHGGTFVKAIVSKEIEKDSENPNIYNYVYGNPYYSDSVSSENQEVTEQVTKDSSLEDHVTVTLAEGSESQESKESSSEVWVSYTASKVYDVYIFDDVTRNQYEEMKYDICGVF